MKYLALISDQDRQLNNPQPVLKNTCQSLLAHAVNNYVGPHDLYDYCNNACYNICPDNLDCNGTCNDLIFNKEGSMPMEGSFPIEPPIPIESSIPIEPPMPVESSFPIEPPMPVEGSMLPQVLPTCPSLATAVNSYNGSQNKYDYCNNTCYNTCPSDFDCNGACDQILFAPPVNPVPETPSPIQDMAMNAVKTCANTLTPGPIGCESKITQCCIDGAGPGAGPDIQNQCQIYAQNYCVNQSFNQPTREPIQYGIRENFQNFSSQCSGPKTSKIIAAILLIVVFGFLLSMFLFPSKT